MSTATGSEMLAALLKHYGTHEQMKAAIETYRAQHGWPPSMTAVAALYEHIRIDPLLQL